MMNAASIARSDASEHKVATPGAAPWRAIIARLLAALDRLPVAQSDPPPELFRYPFP